MYFAISVSCDYETRNGQIVPNKNKYKFSLKCHSFYHMKMTDYHGHPQTTAIGFSLSDDLMSQTEALKAPAVVDNALVATQNLFGSTDANPFMYAMSNTGKNPVGSGQTNANSIDGLL